MVAQMQIKMAFFHLQQRRIQLVLKQWGSILWTNSLNSDKSWVHSFCIFTILMLVLEKTISAAQSLCEARIAYQGYDPVPERAKFNELVRLTEKELFDRCKEIFHWKFKTRKWGKEACNPVRDGASAWQRYTMDERTTKFVEDLQHLTGAFGKPQPLSFKLFCIGLLTFRRTRHSLAYAFEIRSATRSRYRPTDLYFPGRLPESLTKHS
jgi:hypothetical protein